MNLAHLLRQFSAEPRVIVADKPVEVGEINRGSESKISTVLRKSEFQDKLRDMRKLQP